MNTNDAVSLLVTKTIAETERKRLDELSASGRGLDVRVLTGSATDPTDGEAAFFSPDEFPNAPARMAVTAIKAPSLKWLHTLSAGVDHPIFGSLRQRGVRLTTSSGAAAVPIAQAVFMHLLAITRQLPAMMRNRSTATWDRLPGSNLAGTTVVIAGMGPIGVETAKLASAFGMRAIGLRRTITGGEPCETWTLDRFGEAIARADHLVLALPLTPETRLILDESSIGSMRQGASVINVGRGELIDEPALIRALQSGHLGGAGLDVTVVEPLPPDSPLWAMENVILTPHNSAAIPATNVAVVDIFFDNLKRYLHGEPLRNEVAG